MEIGAGNTETSEVVQVRETYFVATNGIWISLHHDTKTVEKRRNDPKRGLNVMVGHKDQPENLDWEFQQAILTKMEEFLLANAIDNDLCETTVRNCRLASGLASGGTYLGFFEFYVAPETDVPTLLRNLTLELAKLSYMPEWQRKLREEIRGATKTPTDL